MITGGKNAYDDPSSLGIESAGTVLRSTSCGYNIMHS